MAEGRAAGVSGRGRKDNQAVMGHEFTKDGPLARRPLRPGLVLEAGSRRFAILELTAETCLIEAPDSATLRGYADIFDGGRHVAQCLILLAAPEGDLLRCSFKRRTAFRTDPPPDYAL
ncbi:MAG: hypothetical protein H0T41_05955 [Rhodobacteraceae bacterium]|nr:hypothetical protein [Paracoccaceae bacterium]